MSSTVSPVRPLTSFLLDRRGRPQRWAVAALTVVAAVAHVPVIAPHLEEAPYMGVLFLLLTIGCSVLALAVLIRDSAAVYSAVAVICGLAVIGYAATRLVSFPMLADDVGNWLEPLGIVSIVSESLAVAAAVWALASRPGTTARPFRTA